VTLHRLHRAACAWSEVEDRASASPYAQIVLWAFTPPWLVVQGLAIARPDSNWQSVSDAMLGLLGIAGLSVALAIRRGQGKRDPNDPAVD